jgi:hypothetical protein
MSILTDTALWHCAHQRRCLQLNRCVCGHDRRRDEDFDAQLKRAMEKYPEQSNPQEQSMQSIDNIQLPRYQSHKKVWALQIKDIKQTDVESSFDGGSMMLVPVDSRYAPIEVSFVDYVQRHKPEAGGYYVVYEDGYKSYSPAGAFESGYTLIG